MSTPLPMRWTVRTLQAALLAWLAWTLLAPPAQAACKLGVPGRTFGWAEGPSLRISRRGRSPSPASTTTTFRVLAVVGGDDAGDIPGHGTTYPHLPPPGPAARRPAPHVAADLRPSRLRC